MHRVAPKPLTVSPRRIRHFFPHCLTDRQTPLGATFEISAMGVPTIDVSNWKLDITGLVDVPMTLTLDDLKRLPKRSLEAVHVCAGNPAKPTVPARRAANVKWGGVDLGELFTRLGIQDGATHAWSYGLDHGRFRGFEQEHYVKDMPISRVQQGDVLIAYELNDAPLAPTNGFPARLVIPGFYGTNSVKWLCRLELADRRPDSIVTTKFYCDPDFEADPSGAVFKPVWALAPESIIVSLKPESTFNLGQIEISGWAWSSCDVRLVEVSVDGGDNWTEASLEQRRGRAWQHFSLLWSPPQPGIYEVCSRATDTNGHYQPAGGARNAIHAVSISVVD
jgi:DMSO/TMAO reductase YedYZ molybdopterin-dependent catalytic subunit